MSKAEQYELAIALALLGIFGAPLFQNFLNGQFAYREQLSLAIIMVLVSIYGLLRLYIAYRQRRENTQSNTPATRGTSRSSVHTPPHRASRGTTGQLFDQAEKRLQSDTKPPVGAPTDNDDGENASQQNKNPPR